MVAQAPANIAPEQVEFLRTEIADVRIEIPPKSTWACHYNRASRIIVISTGAVEICWCAAHAYVSLYDRILVGRTLDLPRKVEFAVDPEVHQATKLLTWAFRKFVNGAVTPWPEHLRRPIANPEVGSPEHVATELALCILGFLIHHEIAHHRLHHVRAVNNDSWNLEQEREADYAAADRIMRDAPALVEVRKRRLYGIAGALALLVAFGIHSGDYGGQTHPRSFDRLLFTLERYIQNDPDHDAWAFVVGILSLHWQNSKMAVPPPEEASSFRGLVEAMVDALAGLSNDRGRTFE
jgi:hypothetical protein